MEDNEKTIIQGMSHSIWVGSVHYETKTDSARHVFAALHQMSELPFMYTSSNGCCPTGHMRSVGLNNMLFDKSQDMLWKYRSTSLCQTCLSRIHGLCRSDRPFLNFSPILHCISTLLMSNSVIMKTRLYRSDFSFPKVGFPFVYHCLYRSGQKVKQSEWQTK